MQYHVSCSQCRGAVRDGGPCQPCGASVHFSPGASWLEVPAVRVDGLEPYGNYTFEVEARNGVSELGPDSHASASLSISMGHAGKRLGWGSVRLGWGDSRGLWTTGELFPLSFLMPCHCGLSEPLSGLSLRLVKKEPRQLELTWAGAWPRSPGGNLSYELHVLNQVRRPLPRYSSDSVWETLGLW